LARDVEGSAQRVTLGAEAFDDDRELFAAVEHRGICLDTCLCFVAGLLRGLETAAELIGPTNASVA
jgi:hypothetical protein